MACAPEKNGPDRIKKRHFWLHLGVGSYNKWIQNSRGMKGSRNYNLVDLRPLQHYQPFVSTQSRVNVPSIMIVTTTCVTLLALP
jgi:hypothetical protein